jgi:hypothetical protein
MQRLVLQHPLYRAAPSHGLLEQYGCHRYDEMQIEVDRRVGRVHNASRLRLRLRLVEAV